MNKLLKLYASFRPFNDREAWGIFKIAAFGEAIGWTLLISGILISKYLTPKSTIAVQIAGHMHGTLFLLYIAMTLLVAPSLRWNITKTLFAGLMSVPPYGTLMFEVWQSHVRQKNRRKQLFSMCYYNKALRLRSA